MSNDTSPCITADHSTCRTSVVCICRNTTPANTLFWKYDALSGGFVSGSQLENPKKQPPVGRLWDSSLQSSNQVILKTADFFPKSIACGLGFRYPPASQLTMRMITAVAGQTNRQRLHFLLNMAVDLNHLMYTSPVCKADFISSRSVT